MAVPAFAAAGSGAVDLGTGGVSCPLVGGISAGHALIIHSNWRESSGGDTVTITTPSGWEVLFDDYFINTDPGFRTVIFGRPADGTEVSSVAIAHDGASGTITTLARMYRFTSEAAYSGLLSDYISGGGLSTGRTAGGTGIAMPTVGGGTVDGLALAFLQVHNDEAIGAATGESGGDWVEAVAEYLDPTGYDTTMQLQTADLSGGGTVSGGVTTFTDARAYLVRGFVLETAAAVADPVYELTDFRIYLDDGVGLGGPPP